MKKIVKKFLGSYPVKKCLQSYSLIKWFIGNKKPPVPHIIKRRAINLIQGDMNLSIFIETGTYLGDMVEEQKSRFKEVISIELDHKLAKKATEKFADASNVEIIRGDSGDVLSRVVPSLKEATMFWLDGHYSAGVTAKGEYNTPIIKELQTILGSNFAHVILIDDARCFIGEDDYPTINEVKEIVKESGRNIKLFVRNDIIFLMPIKG